MGRLFFAVSTAATGYALIYMIKEGVKAFDGSGGSPLWAALGLFGVAWFGSLVIYFWGRRHRW